MQFHNKEKKDEINPEKSSKRLLRLFPTNVNHSCCTFWKRKAHKNNTNCWGRGKSEMCGRVQHPLQPEKYYPPWAK